MADDDLFSLDFTAHSEPLRPVAPTVASVAAQVPAVPSAPTAQGTEKAKEVEKATADFPAALLEAATQHAAGNYLAASRLLEAALKRGAALGEHQELAWQAMFEVLQDLNRRDAFDKLSLAYARHFEKSPPMWISATRAQASETSAAEIRIALPETLSAESGPALKAQLQQASPDRLLHFDLTAIRQLDEAGCTLLLRAINALDAAGRDYQLSGAESLIALLAGQISPLVRSHEALWLLQLALIARTGTQDAFEEAAINYAVTFEVSPPSWEPRAATTSASLPPVVPPISTIASTDTLAMAGEITAPCAALAQQIAAAPAGELPIDGSRVQRIDAAAAQTLLAPITQRNEAGSQVTISELPPLPYLFLCQHGWQHCAVLSMRKF